MNECQNAMVLISIVISILVIKVFSKYLLMTALVEKEHERGIINSMNVIKQYSTMAVSC